LVVVIIVFCHQIQTNSPIIIVTLFGFDGKKQYKKGFLSFQININKNSNKILFGNFIKNYNYF